MVEDPSETDEDESARFELTRNLAANLLSSTIHQNHFLKSAIQTNILSSSVETLAHKSEMPFNWFNNQQFKNVIYSNKYGCKIKF